MCGLQQGKHLHELLKQACYIIPPVKALMFTVCLWNWKVRREVPVRKRYLRGGSLGSLPRVRSMEASRGEGSRLRHDARDWLESSREAIIANQREKKLMDKSKLQLSLFPWNKWFILIFKTFLYNKQNAVLCRVTTCPMCNLGPEAKPAGNHWSRGSSCQNDFMHRRCNIYFSCKKYALANISNDIRSVYLSTGFACGAR